MNTEKAKYGPTYRSLRNEDKALSEEMLSIIKIDKMRRKKHTLKDLKKEILKSPKAKKLYLKELKKLRAAHLRKPSD